MSLTILEQNWKEINTKVLEPLWNKKFGYMYTSSKLDKDDFVSLAHEELTKAFKDYDTSQSNVFTYATNIMLRKAKTELTHYHRKKRVGDIEAESISKLTDEEAQTSLENLLVDTKNEFEEFESDIMLNEILQSLKNDKERKIISLSVQGVDDKSIAQKVGITTKEISQLRERLKNTPAVRRRLRKLGYSLGGIEL